jgi:putative Mg2+ transporter-C (MgtC) family protein
MLVSMGSRVIVAVDAGKAHSHQVHPPQIRDEKDTTICNMLQALNNPVYHEIALRLIVALGVGGLIGLERSYHGRPAGFRTHGLVCLSTALLMLVTVYEALWFPHVAEGRVTLDPTRLAQGIMTGIGFLGAGTIIKEGFSIRGLTTAASIWITAAIGILVGVGFFYPAIIATILTLGTLSAFRWIENRMPMQFYAQLILRFASDHMIAEQQLRELLKEHGFTIANLSYRLDRDAKFFEYRMSIRSQRLARATKLSETLSSLPSVKEFRISTTVD